ncbi:hypothetical protein K2173_010085 [Erythroxylum novogranatense]|uniref:C2H2-type domain-containing protein n=1 Tax=Erythroxylum novogranatense TaxID=1862640 RepID=A0AAV8T0Y9_9ROSI|nr:hypothetical protein K2173_010085 [Erythroxylum novogranatense]
MSNFVHDFDDDEQFQSSILSQSSNGSPNPLENVVALSPRTLMATNRYICEVCHKGFQRDQNLQLHRRGHNLPWKLKQRPSTQVKKRVYVCPEPNCHFCRKHGEKKWKCDKCSKRYAVQSDWKAHTKICGTREYRCDCGTIFSRKDSFVTHRAFCDALAEENYKVNQNIVVMGGILQSQGQELFTSSMPGSESGSKKSSKMNMTMSDDKLDSSLKSFSLNSAGIMMPSNLNPMLDPRNTSLACFSSADGSNASTMAIGSAYTSATALLQKAAEMGAKISDNMIAPILLRGFSGFSSSSMNSSGAILESSSVVGNMGPTTANMNGLYVAADTERYEKNLETSGYEGSSGVSNGLMESPLVMHSGSVSAIGEVYMRGGEKLTVDFLGVEPPNGHSSTIGKRRSFQGNNNLLGLGYSAAAHQNFHNLHPDW